MATPSWDSSEFLLGVCPTCAKQVLTHVDFSDQDGEVRRCVHCDSIIPPRDLRWANVSELESRGYALLEARSCGNGGGCSPGPCARRG